jgi:hypothetical protein
MIGNILSQLFNKTPTTALPSFLNQSFTISKRLGFKNFESLVFGAFLEKTWEFIVFLEALITHFLIINYSGGERREISWLESPYGG